MFWDSKESKINTDDGKIKDFNGSYQEYRVIAKERELEERRIEREKKAKKEAKKEAKKSKNDKILAEAVKSIQSEDEAAPKKEPKAKASKGDDLTKIEGVGPKAAEALTNAGLETFAKVAKAKADKMKEILTEASSRLAHLDTTSWPKQAKMAADEKWDELKAWQDSVKGGVE